MNFDDDALERALFALPLEEPPSDLRASILAATVYRPAPIFSLYERLGLGAIAALLISLLILVAMGGGTLFIHSAQAIGSAFEHSVLNFSTLAWLAAGGATAIWLSIFTGFQPLVMPGSKVRFTPHR
ncbi:MAG: hypothetical protein M3R51_11150 [Candidatus Eremiobacteraeota bacterium]|nr:hypothetical protein [Candidatus Eremiobacteraeota bacterium]